MKRRVSTIILAAIMVLAMSGQAFATTEPILAPTNKDLLGPLVSESTVVSTENGITTIDTTKTYLYEAQPLSETKYYKEKSTSIYMSDIHYATITLDADFYCDNKANTVRCPRYYSSYDIYEDHMVGPEEISMKYTTGGSYSKWGKVTCKYEYKLWFGGITFNESLYVGCDAGGGDV